MALPDAGSASVNAAADQHVVRDSDTTVAVNTQSRRRRRPKRRGGKYQAVSVENSGTIEGRVIYRGSVPEPQPIQIVKDHETCGLRDTVRPRVKVSENGAVEDVVVFLGDIKAGKPIPKPADTPIISQAHCTFVPHVQVLVKGQPFVIVNNDPVAHNAQCVQHMVTVFNTLQPRRGLRSEFTLKRPGLATISCAVHNWMRAYAYVLWHPYYAVTGSDGSFKLTDVPPGEYELVAWQEHLGERAIKVIVEGGKTTEVEFELAGK
jgi:hypothetical protein